MRQTGTLIFSSWKKPPITGGLTALLTGRGGEGDLLCVVMCINITPLPWETVFLVDEAD